MKNQGKNAQTSFDNGDKRTCNHYKLASWPKYIRLQAILLLSVHNCDDLYIYIANITVTLTYTVDKRCWSPRNANNEEFSNLFRCHSEERIHTWEIIIVLIKVVGCKLIILFVKEWIPVHSGNFHRRFLCDRKQKFLTESENQVYQKISTSYM